MHYKLKIEPHSDFVCDHEQINSQLSSKTTVRGIIMFKLQKIIEANCFIKIHLRIAFYALYSFFHRYRSTLLSDV